MELATLKSSIEQKDLEGAAYTSRQLVAQTCIIGKLGNLLPIKI